MNSDIGIRQIDGEICHFTDHHMLDLATAELLIQLLALLIGRVSGNQRRLQLLCQDMQLIEILADNEHLVIAVAVKEYVRNL